MIFLYSLTWCCMKLYTSMFLLFFAPFVGLYAMEESYKEESFKTPMPKKTIAVRGSDGKVIGVSKAAALNTACIHNYLHHAEDISTIFGGKEYSFDGDAISFAERPLFVGVDEDDEPISLDLTAATLKTAFKCIHDVKEIKKLNTREALVRVFDAADFLNAPRDVMRKLTYHAQKMLPLREQPELIQSEHYLNSLRSMRKEGTLKVRRFGTDLEDLRSCVLLCEGQKIDTLKGIEDLAKEYEGMQVQGISFDGNNLKMLDVKQLVQILSCNEIHVRNNRLRQLNLPHRLRDNAVLLLDGNNIQELPHFKVGENGFVDLRKNPLTPEARKIAQRAVKPSFLEMHRHRIKTLLDVNTLTDGMKGVGVAIGCYFISVPISFATGWRLINKFKMLYPEADFSQRSTVDLLMDAYFSKGALLYQLKLCGVASACLGISWLCIGYIHNYNNHLGDQFKPGEVLIDSENPANPQ